MDMAFQPPPPFVTYSLCQKTLATPEFVSMCLALYVSRCVYVVCVHL